MTDHYSLRNISQSETWDIYKGFTFTASEPQLPVYRSAGVWRRPAVLSCRNICRRNILKVRSRSFRGIKLGANLHSNSQYRTCKHRKCYANFQLMLLGSFGQTSGRRPRQRLKWRTLAWCCWWIGNHNCRCGSNGSVGGSDLVLNKLERLVQEWHWSPE